MTSKDEKTIRVGSRKSELALIQTKHVISRLQKLFPAKKFEIHTMSTIGDRVLNISLPKIGEKSLFTRDLEEALRTGGVDFVVHSLKDLPTALPTGMAIGAVLEREDARDALVLRANYKGLTLATLPAGSIIGTSSLRRTAQLKRQYPHLLVCDIRGNLNTRLAKLDAAESKFAGIILAQAGLVRMGWTKRISQVLEPSELLYAVGQGALAVECRANDDAMLAMLRALMCFATTCTILAERSFLKTLGGGCSAPVAVWSNMSGDLLDANGNAAAAAGLSLIGAVWSLDGKTEIRDELSCSLALSGKKRAAPPDTEDNGNGVTLEDASSGSSSGSSSSGSGSPPTKRARSEASSPPQRGSPPVINDDAAVEGLSSAYDIQQLIEKHIDLAKKCPVLALDAQSGHARDNGRSTLANRGGGDAQILEPHCPLQIDVGQDVMGQCPFVSNETKVSMALTGTCPLTKSSDPAASANPSGDEVDRSAAQPSTSKCPFSALHKLKDNESNRTTTTKAAEAIHGKCPFLQKTVQMFDYDKAEKPSPLHFPVLDEDASNIYCGLFQHASHKRDFYVRCEKLGQQLAQELIKKGALDVMKVAQAEIHSKA